MIVRLISQDGREIKEIRENSRILQSGMQKNMSNHPIAGKNYKGFDLQGKFSSKLVKQGLKGSNKTYLNLDPAQ